MKLKHFQEIQEYGKSTLINSLFQENKTEEGLLSERLQRGKNTTTSITLYPINNGYIADTPGFSTFSIDEIESKNLASYFKEFQMFLEKCEYVDCNHIKEEKCGIKQAVEQNKISQERYDRYVKIMQELKEKEMHKRW